MFPLNKRIAPGLCLILALTGIAYAFAADSRPQNCSTFLLKTPAAVLVGHNLDESPGLHVPGLVCINKRGEYREGMTWNELIADPAVYSQALVSFEEKPDPKIRWTSRYGSITFNSEGLDFPDGGMNEKGLSIFEMSMGKTRHREDSVHPTLFICLWVQYQLDNCATLDEVIDNAMEINLQGWAWHYFVSDREGHWAIIEFLDRKPVVYRGETAPFPILCNTAYAEELARIGEYEGFGGNLMLKTPIRKAPRFVRAAERLRDFDPAEYPSPEEYALEILDEIKIKGWNKWGILADATTGKVYFHTNRNRNLRFLSFADFDFSQGSPSRILDIHADHFGNVAADFTDYTYEKNLAHTRERAVHLFKKRFKGLIDKGMTAEVYARRFADYSRRMRSGQNHPPASFSVR